LIGITGDIAFDEAEAVVGPMIIATMLLPYLVPPLLVRQIARKANEPAVSRKTVFRRRHVAALSLFDQDSLPLSLEDITGMSVAVWKHQT
jgi:hypothetical protein